MLKTRSHRMGAFALSLSLALLMGALSGCFTHRITVGNGGHVKRSDKMEFFFINGLIGTADINPRAICGGDNATIEITHTILNSLIGGCTSGLLTPTQVTVYCGNNDRAESMTLTKDQQLAMMHSDAFVQGVEEQAPELLDDVEAARAATSQADASDY